MTGNNWLTFLKTKSIRFVDYERVRKNILRVAKKGLIKIVKAYFLFTFLIGNFSREKRAFYWKT